MQLRDIKLSKDDTFRKDYFQKMISRFRTLGSKLMKALKRGSRSCGNLYRKFLHVFGFFFRRSISLLSINSDISS
jgi:hypothetical protein